MKLPLPRVVLTTCRRASQPFQSALVPLERHQLVELRMEIRSSHRVGHNQTESQIILKETLKMHPTSKDDWWKITEFSRQTLINSMIIKNKATYISIISSGKTSCLKEVAREAQFQLLNQGVIVQLSRCKLSRSITVGKRVWSLTEEVIQLLTLLVWSQPWTLCARVITKMTPLQQWCRLVLWVWNKWPLHLISKSRTKNS